MAGVKTFPSPAGVCWLHQKTFTPAGLRPREGEGEGGGRRRAIWAERCQGVAGLDAVETSHVGTACYPSVTSTGAQQP